MQLLDLGGVFYLSVFGIPQDEYSLDNLRKSILKSIFFLNNQFKKDYGQLVICKDSKSNWRKIHFEQYKAKRKENREADDRDWDLIFKDFETIISEIKENLPFIVLEIEGLEADDLIALCVKNLKDSENHIILSSDKDMMQLLSKSNIKQYSLLKREEIIYDQTKLKELIIKGDSSDGVPNIYSSNNIFLMEGIRQKSVSSKLLEEIDISSEEKIREYFENEYDELIKKEEKKKEEDKKIKVTKEAYVNDIIKNFNRNKLMIDLNMIPEKYIFIFKQTFLDSYKKSRDASLNTRNYTMKHYLSSFYYNEFHYEGGRIES